MFAVCTNFACLKNTNIGHFEMPESRTANVQILSVLKILMLSFGLRVELLMLGCFGISRPLTGGTHLDTSVQV